VIEYRNVGRTGLKVSSICLGTMTFGRSANEAESAKMVSAALDRGINFFDTANSYSEGDSEVLLGKGLKGKREQAVVATKFFNPMGEGPNDSGMSRAHIMQAIEASLRRLEMDYVDLYYIHHVDVQTPLEEMLRAVDDLVRQGKVRYLACSNYEAWRLCDALWTSTAHGLSRIECYQPQYSLVVRDIEQELIPLCTEKGVGVVVWAPLAGGFLSGKYAPGERTVAGSRSEEGWAYPQAYFAANCDDTLRCLLEVAERAGCPPGAAAVRWVIEQPGITSAIVGASSMAQLLANLRAIDLTLGADDLQKLSEVSSLPPRYPSAMEADMLKRRDSAVRRS